MSAKEEEKEIEKLLASPPQKRELQLNSDTYFKPNLNLESNLFVPSEELPKIQFSPTKTENPEKLEQENGSGLTPSEILMTKFNLNAPLFKPVNFQPAEAENGATAKKKKKRKNKDKQLQQQQKEQEDKLSAEKQQPKVEKKAKVVKEPPQMKKYQIKGTAQAQKQEEEQKKNSSDSKTDENNSDDVKEPVTQNQNATKPRKNKAAKSKDKDNQGADANPQAPNEKSMDTDKDQNSRVENVAGQHGDKQKSHKIIKRSRDQQDPDGKLVEPVPPHKNKAKTAVDPLQGYQPPFKNKDAKKKKVEGKNDGKQDPSRPRKVYTIDLIFTLRPVNKQRPDNMAELDFPHKKRGTNTFRKKVLTEKDKFNKMVGEIRILLNKLSLSNFETIAHKLLTNFQYTPSLLYELMKMIFIKSTGEHSYLDVYVKLCALLFKKFNDPENHEMNFKKLLITKCQKQFFKMLNKEREQRKKRRDSITLLETQEQTPATGEAQAADNFKNEQDFSKQMMNLYDDDELQERKKEQMYGNMYLLTELFIARQLNGNIIKTCLDDLQQEMDDQNVEIICYMMNKLMTELCRQAKYDLASDDPASQSARSKRQSKVINLDYGNTICLKLFDLRNNKDMLQVRTRFKIQDLMDSHIKEWKSIVQEWKRRTTDNEGYKQIYVPKDQILTEDQVFHNSSARTGKDRKNQQSYIYRAKSIEKTAPKIEVKQVDEEKNDSKQSQNKMQSLLSSLKAEDNDAYVKYTGTHNESSDDEDFQSISHRRVSMNAQNLTGMNFQKYQESKPAAGVRREILNLFQEYKENESKEHARDELISISEQYDIKKFQFVGYFLNNALSEKPEDFNRYKNLCFEYFFLDQKLLDGQEMLESVNVCVAHLPDLIIDYPNASSYAVDLVKMSATYKIIAEEDAEKYLKHIESLDE